VQILYVGRGHDNDLRIGDISVSRQHAILLFDGKSFKIGDSGSKFGTLIALKEPMRIEPNQNYIL
jgi:pSer/pThr/pTyr-binding forkhead associated (FHA) protein